MGIGVFDHFRLKTPRILSEWSIFNQSFGFPASGYLSLRSGSLGAVIQFRW